MPLRKFNQPFTRDDQIHSAVFAAMFGVMIAAVAVLLFSGDKPIRGVGPCVFIGGVVLLEAFIARFVWRRVRAWRRGGGAS